MILCSLLFARVLSETIISILMSVSLSVLMLNIWGESQMLQKQQGILMRASKAADDTINSD